MEGEAQGFEDKDREGESQGREEDEDDDEVDTDFEEWKYRERERRKKAKEERRKSLEKHQALAARIERPDNNKLEGVKDEKSKERNAKSKAKERSKEIAEKEKERIEEAEDEELSNRIIKLNIGGRKYATSAKTLIGGGKDNYFTALFRDQFAPPTMDDKGYHFIDRNGSLFEPILDYLRTGQWVCPNDLPEWVYLREARFYSIFPTPYTSLSDKCLNERLNRERDTSRKLKCKKYEKEFSEIKRYLLESFIPQVDEGKADVFSPIFFPSTKTILERLQASGRGWTTTKKEIKKKFQSKNTTIVFNDSLYNAIRSASALLLWDLKTNHGLTVEIYYKNGIGLVKKDAAWEMVDWLPYETENGIRGFRFIWSQSKLAGQ